MKNFRVLTSFSFSLLLLWGAVPVANAGTYENYVSNESTSAGASIDNSPQRLPAGTIALCNAGFGDVSVQRYENARFLGVVDLRCGDEGAGYVHIRLRHQGSWQGRIDSVGSGGNWDDLMAWVTGEALQRPQAGYPKDVGGGKWCYTAPIFMSGPRGTVQFNPTIIVSTNNKNFITSYPTDITNC